MFIDAATARQELRAYARVRPREDEAMGWNRSEEFYEEAQKWIPGGVNSPVRSARAVAEGIRSSQLMRR